MPVRKLTAAALGGAVATIVATIIQAVTGAQPPPGLEGAVATLAAFAFGYLVPASSADDQAAVERAADSNDSQPKRGNP